MVIAFIASAALTSSHKSAKKQQYEQTHARTHMHKKNLRGCHVTRVILKHRSVHDTFAHNPTNRKGRVELALQPELSRTLC